MHLKTVATWAVGYCLFILVGLSYFAGVDLGGKYNAIARRLVLEIQPSDVIGPIEIPAQQVSKGVSKVVLVADGHGQFFAAVQLNNRRLNFLVDTGASTIILRYEDAKKIGINPYNLDFIVPFQSANGQAYAAPVIIKSIRLGTIRRRNVHALVTQKGTLETNLLGMSFLEQLSVFTIKNGIMILKG